MSHPIVIALRTTAFTLVVTGLLYPLATTGLCQALFPSAAAGSLVSDDRGRVVGSELIGQPFARAAYFQPRPSAAGSGFDATASSGSNFGTTSRKLRERVEAEIARLRRDNPTALGEVPEELVTASASGLDPHLSPAGAEWQIPRLAAARGVAAERIHALVEVRTEGRTLGFLGEPRINVLLLNLALDRQFGAPSL